MPKKLPLAIPLILDFDGTLHHGDVFWLGLVALFKARPWQTLAVVLTLLCGKVTAKLKLAAAAQNLPLVLHWDMRVLAAAQEAQAQGRAVYVATGSPQVWVENLLRSKGLNWPVLGTTATSGNLVGRRKAAKLVMEFGAQGFDYAGNSHADIPVWAAAHGAWVANAPKAVRDKAKNILKEFPPA